MSDKHDLFDHSFYLLNVKFLANLIMAMDEFIIARYQAVKHPIIFIQIDEITLLACSKLTLH